MKKAIVFFCGMIAAFTLTGCATIISGSNKDVTITTNAPSATVKVRNSSGLVMHHGNAPLTVNLKTSKGFFSSASYHIDVIAENRKKQTRVLSAYFNAWFLGNFIFGGWPGMLVDGISGACYLLDDSLYVHFPEFEE